MGVHPAATKFAFGKRAIFPPLRQDNGPPITTKIYRVRHD